MMSVSNASTECVRLVAELERSEKNAIRAAVDALIALAPSCADVKKLLSERLADPQRKNRWAIAYVLAQLPHRSAATLDALIGALGHGDAEVRWAVGLLLARIGGNDPAILRAVTGAATGGDPLQRRMAIYCLRDLDTADAVHGAVFATALADTEPLVRIAAIAGLKKSGLAQISTRNKLFEIFFADDDSRVRCVAAVTLAQIGAREENFVRALEAAESSDDARIRRAAGAALSLLQK